MSIALLLLAAAGPCAVPTLCPSAKEIMAAIYRYADANTPVSEMPKDPLIIWVPSRVLGLSEVICGDAIPGAPGSVDCKYTVRYADARSYEVATFVRRDGKWVITDKHGVWRKR